MKPNRFLVIILSTTAIACGTWMGSMSATLLAQNRSPFDNQSDSTRVGGGLGIVTLAGRNSKPNSLSCLDIH